MNVRDMKGLLVGLDDDLLVCGSGHFGEALEIYYGTRGDVSVGTDLKPKQVSALILHMEHPGEEPE